MRWRGLVACLAGALLSPPAVAYVYGTDERQSPESTTFTVKESVRFSGIGRIECKTEEPEESRAATAFMVIRKRMLVTVAHVFFSADGTRRTDCKVVYYSPQGTPLDEIPVIAIRTRWDAPMARNDYSNDIGYVLLARDPMFGTPITQFAVNVDLKPASDVEIVGFPAPRKEVKRRLPGKAWKALPGDCIARNMRARGLKAANAGHLAIGDFDSDHGASGAPVFTVDGTLIGVHFGGCGGPKQPFNAKNNYNSFILFDDRFDRELRALVAEIDQPSAARTP